MNDDEDFIHKCHASFLSSNNYEDVSLGSDYDSVKRTVCRNKTIILDLLLNKSMIFEWQVSWLFLVINEIKLS